MTAAAARYGYGGASVARVVAQAGVSRATFYEHFADKEDCFLAAYRDLAGSIKRAVARHPAEWPRAMLEALLAAADREPAAARIVLIEAFADGSEARCEHEDLLAAFERAIDAHQDELRAGTSRLEIPPRALLGGISNLIAIRVFRGEAGRLSELLDDILAWVGAYAVPAGRSRRSAADWEELGRGFPVAEEGGIAAELGERYLPRGRGALEPAIVSSEQRIRVMAAVAQLSRRKGYAAMSVADVVSAAAVTREAFYEQFRNKEDAFLAVQSLGLEQSVSLTAASFFGTEHWPERVWNGLEAMFGYVAGQPDLAHADLIESYAAGAAAIRRSYDNWMAYTLFLEDGYRQRPEAERLPRLCLEAIGGAVQELLRRQVVQGRTARMMEVLPQAAYVTLAPFVGPAEALELVEAKCATALRGAPSKRSPVRPAVG